MNLIFCKITNEVDIKSFTEVVRKEQTTIFKDRNKRNPYKSINPKINPFKWIMKEGCCV